MKVDETAAFFADILCETATFCHFVILLIFLYETATFCTQQKN